MYYHDEAPQDNDTPALSGNNSRLHMDDKPMVAFTVTLPQQSIGHWSLPDRQRGRRGEVARSYDRYLYRQDKRVTKQIYSHWSTGF